MESERLDADRQFANLFGVANTAVHHDASPAIAQCERRHVAADQRATQGAAAIDDQYPLLAGLFQHGPDEGIVLEYFDGHHSAVETGVAAVVPEQRFHDWQVRMSIGKI